MRHKHVVGHNGFHGALYYHGRFDKETFALELDRTRGACRKAPLPSIYRSSTWCYFRDQLQGNRWNECHFTLQGCEADTLVANG